jgi:hypothetical protein
MIATAEIYRKDGIWIIYHALLCSYDNFQPVTYSGQLNTLVGVQNPLRQQFIKKTTE